MSTVKFIRSDGKVLNVNGTDWILAKADGIASLSVEIFTEKQAIGDGDIVTGIRLPSRMHTYRFLSVDREIARELHYKATSFFNKDYSFKVYVTYLDRTLWISSLLSKPAIVTGRESEPVQVTVEFISPNPYWQSVDPFGKDIASVNPLHDGEEIFDSVWGGVFDSFVFDRKLEIDNDGDATTNPVIRIEADADVLNPKIINGDSYIRILDTMHAGDAYTLDIIAKTITKNGVNAINKVDRTSNFNGMAFVVGSNVISYDADDGTNAMRVIVSFNKQYLGV